MPDADWHVALGFALVGVRLDLPPHTTPDADALVADLAALGWDAARLADAVVGLPEGTPWPFPVPAPLREGLGAAQFHAALGRVRGKLGLSGTESRRPSPERQLNADERRLLAEVPPHHVPPHHVPH